MSREDRARLEAIQKRDLPQWFDDAKFGIFLHWGPATVPAYAPPDSDFNEIFRTNYDNAFAFSPYAEWYQNVMQFEQSPTHSFHQENHGPEVSYDDFAEQFKRDVVAWDPEDWADIFADIGARYVVLVTKHHDGFLLWPSVEPNPHKDAWQTERDLVGELAAAVRNRGLRFGTYYSGGIDWSFEPSLSSKPMVWNLTRGNAWTSRGCVRPIPPSSSCRSRPTA